MKICTLPEVINSIKDFEIVKATLFNEGWYITKQYGHIWYCDKNGVPDTIIPLTFSNMQATYYME